jgi:3,4-dihydroxy 2-butanone 4-phosphate synthase/GTP cyclohydrolase II
MTILVHRLPFHATTQGRVDAAVARCADGGLVVIAGPTGAFVAGAASAAHPEQIAFIVRYTSGFLRVALPGDVCRRLGLPPMSCPEVSTSEAFAVTVDAREGVSTGISARDRARTIGLLSDPATRPDDLARPGHVVPVRLADGGVLQRAGIAEAAADLAVEGGLERAAVYAELVSDDGPLLAGAAIDSFCRVHDLPMVSVADLVHRRAVAADPLTPARAAGQ